MKVRFPNMTKGLVRYQQTGDLHFITFSCYDRRPYLGDAAARNLFEHSLETMRRRYDFFITAYVLMPEHVHLLVSEPQIGSLARTLQALKLSVAVQRTERPFWQRRYYDFNLYGARKLIEKRRYIHRNPVTRGLVKEPDEWKWSSFHHWWTGQPGIVEIESHWTARRREGAGIVPQNSVGT
jgi:putative transposase